MHHAVILAGGGGTRLWPASRRRKPKQFLPLGPGGEPLLSAAVRRMEAIAKPLVVTSQTAQTAQVVPGVEILAEPAPRNTAAAIALAAAHLHGRDPQAVIGVIPADQHIGDEARFRALAERAFALAAERDAIVTIGIKPNRPETGFGYLELGAAVEDAHEVARFVEKPDAATAAGYATDGRHLWNAGMFFFRAERMLAEVSRHLPEHAAALRDRTLYPALPSISIDYGVMEKTRGILTLAGDFGWSDIGSWPAVADLLPKDPDGNASNALLAVQGARNNVVSADPGVLVALIGVEDLIVVQAGDALLVAPRDRAQDVKEIVAQLERRKLDTYL